MAHLNLVKIHPFRDGNGRMSRILQTAVLAQEEVLEPPFASIEEWLGDNTQDYHRAIQATSGPRPNPEHSADLWVKFNLRAHHLQAQTHLRRFEEAQQVFLRLTEAAETSGLPDRVVDPLYEAHLGFTLTRHDYARLSLTEARTATRDLALLVQAGCLVATGTTKSRIYGPGPVVAQLKDQIAAGRGPLADPYPGLLGDIAAREAAVSP
jgi:Fic family protein